ncbi:hypothetical protein GCM10025734_79610 [Kitasatospora paranensis]
MTSDSTDRFTLGDVEVLRIVEWQGAFAPARTLVPDSAEALWKDNEEWLAPDHWEPDSDRATVALQTWVLRSGGRTVLVDTAVGNGRERPGSPNFHHWQGDFMERLARAGLRPEDVDVVVNTHVHGDHVGWNTADADGEWVPAFPNARYLVPAADDFHFGPANGYGGGLREDDRLIYEDSIAPVHRAGQVELWDGTHRIDDNLVLESAPGHTPARRCCASPPAATGRSSSGTCCTARCRSSAPSAAAASVWTRRRRPTAAGGSSTGPRRSVSWSSRRTSAAAARSRSGGTAADSRSTPGVRSGHPTRAGVCTVSKASHNPCHGDRLR